VPKALITGVSGQDGAYLAELLINKGYEVIGTSRNIKSNLFSNLISLNIKNKLNLIGLDLQSFSEVKHCLENEKYDEIYHLAGESSVGKSFKNPYQVIGEIQIAVSNILEATRIIKSNSNIFFAGSGDCYGDTGGVVINEMTEFKPKSPYAVAKSSAYWQVKLYRELYNLNCCTGILFNHESPLRNDQFVTGKILSVARRIAEGSKEKLELGDISVQRDWGWAPEYVEAMWLMLKQEKIDDYIISTGFTCSLCELIENIFNMYGLNWLNHVIYNESFKRTSEILTVKTDPTKIKNNLNWHAQIFGNKLAEKLVNTSE
jgi:GDPmannose 4,6-dehydratase